VKKIIKLTTPWDHDFLKRTPGGTGIFGNYRFEINNACSECDYWVVWGGLRDYEKVKCPPQNRIYITDESHSERTFYPEFLAQFPTVIACRKDIIHPHLIASHDLGIWHFNKSYDEVANLKITEKSKRISVVSSDLTLLEGHRKRLAYLKQLQEHFRDRVDYFGRGINPLPDKFDGIANYSYSVAIENSFLPGYFTEKLFECFLTNTFPLYYGCPDLENYFDNRSFARIDINAPEKALAITEEILKQDRYHEVLPYVVEAKKRYLNEYYFFPAVIRIIEKDDLLREAKRSSACVVFPESFYRLSTPRKGYIRLKKYFQ
jgi:hypothetical protein